MSVKRSKTRSTGAFTSVETLTFAIVNPPVRRMRRPPGHVEQPAEHNSIIHYRDCVTGLAWILLLTPCSVIFQ